MKEKNLHTRDSNVIIILITLTRYERCFISWAENDRSKYLILGRSILICACRNTFSYALMPFLLKIIPIFLKILIKDFKNCQHQLRASNNSFEEISLLCNYYCNICALWIKFRKDKFICLSAFSMTYFNIVYLFRELKLLILDF